MSNRDELTERQVRMLRMIREYTIENGYPPTIREIGARVGITSTSVVSHNVKSLQKKGYLTRDENVSRGLRLVEEDRVVSIPLLGTIAAGSPIPVAEDELASDDMEYISTCSELVPNPDQVYALRVKGHSMVDAMIADGDIVLVRHQTAAENGDTVVAWLPEDRETTLKSFFLEPSKGRVRLQPRNPNYEPIYKSVDQVEVQGRVIGVIRRFS